MKYYDNFNNKNVDGQSLVHLINLLLPKKVIGLEIGVSRALSFCTFLQQCPSIIEMHGIDPYLPYEDYLKYSYDGTPLYSIDEKEIDFSKITAYHNIKYSGHAEKVIFHEKKSFEVVNNFNDNYFDFIFIDSYMKPGEIYEEIQRWYPKLKQFGLFAGHDWDCNTVNQEVMQFIIDNNISKFSSFDNTWCLIKPIVTDLSEFKE